MLRCHTHSSDGTNLPHSGNGAKLTVIVFSRKVMVAPGFEGGVEQLARRMSPGSYLVCSVHRVGGECGSSVGDRVRRKHLEGEKYM